MCGIFGIVAGEELPLGPILIESGRRLAYRGYDSVGCATVQDGAIDLRKGVGKIEAVSQQLDFSSMRGTRGIIQLRWATFGAPAQENAQPHLDCDGDMVGAHNGNIVNNVQLRSAFMASGHLVRGENDGETCVHAVERHYDQCGDMVEAIRRAYQELAGDYAFVITLSGENRLYAVKKGSGLVVGLGEGVTCCSSDLPSILPITRHILRVQDGEVVVLTPDGATLHRVSDGGIVERESEWYAGGMEAAEKGGFAHFMLKEIHEQPRVARELLHLLSESTDVDRFVSLVRSSTHVYLVGCGTSYHASLLGSYYFGRLAAKTTIPVLPQQLVEQYGECLDETSAAVFVSQSGETKDVLNAVKLARTRKAGALGLVNVVGSMLTHVTKPYLPLACGYELSVPATKTFMNQAIAFLYLAYRLSGKNVRKLDQLPDLLAAAIEGTSVAAERVAGRLSSWDEMYYLGYGVTHPIALEGALKLKEITYAHCEGIFSSEFKHGPLSAVRPGYPVLFITAPDDVEMMINHVNEVTCRDGVAIAVAESDDRLRQNVHEILELPAAGQLLNPILATIPVQLIAYHMSVGRGIDPDFPRNLSKTLTVD